MSATAWVDDDNAALLTDLYELTMLQAYRGEGMDGEAVFSLYVRRLPERRRFLLACGLDDALRYLERLRFTGASLEALGRLGGFDDAFLAWLADFRFQGDVWAVPEGTPVFAEEPILEVVAPLPQAQLVETFLMNQVHLETLLASKAARVVLAARGRPVVDFGLRRIPGTDAGMKAARAFHVAGVEATSNVLAATVYEGVEATGTMAHSYVQAHDDEREAFRRFARRYPGTTLLVDTYDTLEGVRRVADLCRADPAVSVGAVRLDSGDLGTLARGARAILDAAGLETVRIFASGGLDEDRIAELVAGGAPIDAFGVGTHMGTSADAPDLDIAYKLTEYAGRGRVKRSPGKRILPGRKQVFRRRDGGRLAGDVLAGAGETHPGEALLVKVMAGGRRTAAGSEPLAAMRARAARALASLPPAQRSLEPGGPAYPVIVSAALEAAYRRLAREAAE